MAKFKVYDIQPPREREVSTTSKKRGDQKILLRRRLFIILALLIVAFIVITQFLNASSARIEIWPKTEQVEFQVFLTARTDSQEIDILAQTIPVVMLEKEVVLSKEFQSSETESAQEAEGTIRVHNKYRLPVRLVAKTRFLSSTEPTRLFLAKNKFTVPANGYVDVPVIASESGNDYNIEPCSFSIPGLRNFSPPELYYEVTGRSSSRMEGGSTAKVSKITQDDLDKAQKTLKAEAENKALDSLKELAGSEYRVLEKTIETEIVASGPVDAKLNQLKDTFLYEIKIESRVLAVKNTDLSDFISRYLDSKIPPEQEVNKDSVHIKTLAGNIDIEEVITIDIEFEIMTYSRIDMVSIKEVARNQKPSNIRKYILEIYPEIEIPPKVKLKPFFFVKAPANLENIEIITRFD